MVLLHSPKLQQVQDFSQHSSLWHSLLSFFLDEWSGILLNNWERSVVYKRARSFLQKGTLNGTLPIHPC